MPLIGRARKDLKKRQQVNQGRLKPSGGAVGEHPQGGPLLSRLDTMVPKRRWT
jgi:hypothetical protein